MAKNSGPRLVPIPEREPAVTRDNEPTEQEFAALVREAGLWLYRARVSAGMRCGFTWSNGASGPVGRFRCVNPDVNFSPMHAIMSRSVRDGRTVELYASFGCRACGGSVSALLTAVDLVPVRV